MKQEYVQLQNDIKIVRTLKLFSYKNLFGSLFSLSIAIVVMVPTAAIFRQSAGYVYNFQRNYVVPYFLFFFSDYSSIDDKLYWVSSEN